jgi:hypothetical protein
LRIAETLRLQLAPPPKSSLHSYFSAAAASSGVTVSSVRESILTAVGTCIQLDVSPQAICGFLVICISVHIHK